VQPGTFSVEPDLAGHWETPNDTTYIFQRYAAEHQYYVHLHSVVATASWAPYAKNYSPNMTFDYGSRAAALWLER
jgi:hypothetical protein